MKRKDAHSHRISVALLQVLPIIVILCCCICCCLTSCRTAGVPAVPPYADRDHTFDSVRIEYRDRVQHDSIYVTEYIRERMAGDTVFIDRVKTEYKYLYIDRTDTVRISAQEEQRTDSVTTVTVEVPVPVPAELKVWQRALMVAGVCAVVFLIGCLVTWYMKVKKVL